MEPLLLDEPYSVRRPQGGGRGRDGGNVCGSGGEGDGGDARNSASAAAATPLPSVAALEAYRRQWWGPAAGGGASTAKAGGAGGARHMLALKGRPPSGAGPADFGPGHVPGLLPQPPPGAPAVPNLPPQTGLGRALPPPRLHARSCVPPPFPEPLGPPDDPGGSGGCGPAALEAARRDAERLSCPGALAPELVYDALLAPPPPEATQEAPGAEPEANGFEGGGGVPLSSAAAAAAAASSAWAYAPGLDAWRPPASPSDPTLVFESRFEGGNLRRALRVRPFEYDLVLQPDVNTRGHTQWWGVAS